MWAKVDGSVEGDLAGGSVYGSAPAAVSWGRLGVESVNVLGKWEAHNIGM